MYIRVFFCLFFSINSFLFSQKNRFSSQNDTTNTEIILGSNNQHLFLKNGDYILKKNLQNVLLDSFLFKNKAPKNHQSLAGSHTSRLQSTRLMTTNLALSNLQTS